MKYLLNIFHFQSILDVDVNTAALVVVLPRRNKKAQPKEQTS
jgi:hypothetical protein